MSADVEHAGWAVGGPGSRLRRRRGRGRTALAAALVVAGIAAAGFGLVRLVMDAGPEDRRVLARGVVAALDGDARPAVAFRTAAAEDITFWLVAGGLSNVRDTVVAGTTCVMRRADGSTVEVLGRIQGASVATDDHATIGSATTTPGVNAVLCRHVPFGRLGRRGALRRERPFLVERGTPGDGLAGMIPLFGGIAAIVGGVLLGRFWPGGTLRSA
jgi:hypothetical protein